MKDEKEKRQTTLVYNQALHKCSVGKKVREHEKFSNRHIFLRKDFSIKDKQNPGNIYLYTQKHTHTKTCIYSIITEHESVFNRHKRQLKNIVELIKATLMKKIETVKDQRQKKIRCCCCVRIDILVQIQENGKPTLQMKTQELYYGCLPN